MEEIARVESDFTTGHDEFIPNLPNFCARCERQSNIDFFSLFKIYRLLLQLVAIRPEIENVRKRLGDYT